MKRYSEIMQEITVSDEMYDRILNNISVMDFEQEKKENPFIKYKKYYAYAACFLCLFVGVMTLPNLLKSKENTPEEPSVTITPNIVEYQSLEELSQAIGFEMPEIRNLPFESKTITYLTIADQVAEIEYANDSWKMTFRKSIGTEDRSGDYNIYNTEKKVENHNVIITLKGNQEQYQLALWLQGDYSYSLQLSQGISEEEFLDIISQIN